MFERPKEVLIFVATLRDLLLFEINDLKVSLGTFVITVSVFKTGQMFFRCQMSLAAGVN